MIKKIAFKTARQLIQILQQNQSATLLSNFCFSTEQKSIEQREQPKIVPSIDETRKTKVTSSPTHSLSDGSKTASNFQSISNEGRRVQLQIFSTQQEPAFIKQYIESSNSVNLVKYFNVHMTNGGEQFEEFPLIKILSIALKYLSEDNIQEESWKKMEFFIKKRLHRCTVEQNLKLLYIMLKAFPKYTFDYGFILSICLALKKEINIMSPEQLKALFYVLHTNRNEEKRYHNPILANLQSLVLTKVLEKCQKKLLLQQSSKGTHLPIEYLYSWIMFGFTLSVRNNYYELIFEEKAIELMRHFNQRWLAAVSKEQRNKITSENQIANIIYFMSIFQRLVDFKINQKKIILKQQKENSVSGTFQQQFSKFKLNVIAHTSRKISKIITNDSTLQKLRTFRCLLQLYSFDLVENILSFETEADEKAPKHTLQPLYPKIVSTFTRLIACEEKSQQAGLEIIKLLNNLFNRGLLSFEAFRSYYRAISFHFEGFSSSLDLVNQLIISQLYLFLNQQTLDPQSRVTEYVLSFLENLSHTYRDFDWRSFHYVTLLIEKQANNQMSISSNLPVQLSQQDKATRRNRLTKILKKIGEEVKFYNTEKLVNQEIQILKNKQSIKDISKFFIEIRVNEMEQLKPILAPFNRLPHFSNSKQKLAINSFTKEQMERAEHKLQKKLMNISGWKVIHLNSASFIDLSLNERLKFIAQNLQKESQLISNQKNSQLKLTQYI